MLFERSLIENILPKHNISKVAHYTRIGTLCHFIPEGAESWASAWASPIQFLNDRMELSLGLQVLKDVETDNQSSIQTLKPLAIITNKSSTRLYRDTRILDILNNLTSSRGSLRTDAFQMSFSGNPDELGQWRGYAANGMGCSVVTDVKAVKKSADVAGWVIYDETEQRKFARGVLDKLREEDNDTIEQVLIAAASFMKHKGFQPEMEFRLIKFPNIEEIKFRETGERMVPYFDFLRGKLPLPLRRILIGPGWQLSRMSSNDLFRHHVVQGIHRLLEARGLDVSVSIESSSIPYDPK